MLPLAQARGGVLFLWKPCSKGSDKMYNGICFTARSDMERIIQTAYAILEQVGVCVESRELIEILQETFPSEVTLKSDRLLFSASLSERVFLSGENQCESSAPTASCRCEIYEGYYLDPVDGAYKEWTEDRLLSYFALAKAIGGEESVHMLGCPLQNFPAALKPLYEKLYCFQYGIGCGGALWDTALCGPILEMFSVYADEVGKPVSQVFSGCIYLLTPLKLGHVEAEQLMWFYHHGVRVGIGILASLGMSVPVTLAGAIAEHLAEQLFIGIINCALFGDRVFHLSSDLSCADLRTGMFQYGRPEQVILNNALADIARAYRMGFHAHGGLTDAKVPGFEAGVQKMGTAMANIFRGHDGYLAGGLLSVDEVCSPVQLVLDREAANYLKRICAGFPVDQESLALETIRECVQEDIMFFGSEHTVLHGREIIWRPEIFSCHMFSDWSQTKRSDVDFAREKAITLLEEPICSQISQDCEQRLRNIIIKESKKRGG